MAERTPLLGLGTPHCRTDYLCESVTEAGTNQTSTVSVCIGPAG